MIRCMEDWAGPRRGSSEGEPGGELTLGMFRVITASKINGPMVLRCAGHI